MTLEERVAALEQRLGMEADARASADRDLSDITTVLRAQRHLVQALSITQGEHTETLTQHSESLSRIESGVTRILRMLEQMS
jgi:hypothetical protein